jgi:type II secretory pathway component PulF
MSLYAYLCLDARGQEIRGQMEAAGLTEARGVLKGQGLKILSLAEGGAGRDWRSTLAVALRALSRMRSIGNGDRMLFYRQMQLMLKAGHTLLEALTACAHLTAKARLADALQRIAAAIQRGSTLSAACGGEKEVFNRLAQKLLEAGEASGELDAVFERLAMLLERRGEVRRQLITALVYPGFVLLAAIGVISFLVVSVVPRFATFLSGRGKAIPWAAQTMLDISDWLGRWGWLIGVCAIVLAVSLPLLRQIPVVRYRIDRLLVRVPVLGGALTSAAMAQVTWTFGVLVKSRLTVLEALRTCTQVVANAGFSRAFARAAEQVLAGRTLATALDQPALPRLVRHMAAVGEKSGQLDTVMEALGQHYQKELDARVKLLAAMIEPALTVVIGGVVGFVYYAFFQAMMAVSTGA